MESQETHQQASLEKSAKSKQLRSGDRPAAMVPNPRFSVTQLSFIYPNSGKELTTHASLHDFPT